MRSTRLALVVLAIAALTLGCAAGPTPGQVKFLDAMREIGVQGDDQRLLEAAEMACAARPAHVTPANVFELVQNTSDALVREGLVESRDDGHSVALVAELACE